MAIGVLLNEIHLTWHDFESFFWVLFWIYIYYNRLNKKSNVIDRFDKWNSVDMKELAKMKKGAVAGEEDFLKTAGDNFLLYY